ncbi:ABC-type transport system involved in cytochrome c biogenesis, permease component [Neorhodopirellula lusitana]|uniref:ABC-type transport system involved in cytochrome c biogenesis, permease component n=1 Tax=Neorhodopirellula lusitana TaxID=445327 RepID=A0ABY1PQR2_9BACT|nr:cytochrome c biogenesis protein CcsA [Neorhodopirellula lusitana]SMP38261.1 ABC-type transport system involved in cytochrome c biogenesis, permease component [Neorhodopirellula lusitana]
MATVTNQFPTDARSDADGWIHPKAGAGVLAALGSLKFTVALFALSLILVLVGTLAQDQLNMQEVKARYFLSWVAMMHIDDFFPQAFYRHDKAIPGIIPFPGGAMIGLLLMVNLVAAKITRFHLQAKGTKLIAGLAFLATGIAIAGLIVFLGQNDEGLQGTPPISYDKLWALILAVLAVSSVGCALAATTAKTQVFRWCGFVAAALLAIYVVYSLSSGYRIGDPGLRIVWQLAKGVGAGLVMLVGCQMAFGKQGGNVLLHLGVGLLMVGQFAFGDRQTEQRLSLIEGQSTNTFVNLDEVELQLIRTEDEVQQVTAVPASRLIRSADENSVITHDGLPIKIKTIAFYENSSLGDVPEDNPADHGFGLEVGAKEVEKSGGASMSINLPSAYIELINADTDESLGKFLVTQQLNDREMLAPDGKTKDLLDSVDVKTKSGEEQTYQIGLRLHREVKPYWIQLDDVRRINWSGSDTPRDYSSFIRIVDPELDIDRKERVWMNNPLRYRGETFYQSNYTALPGGKELTGIQVVRNSGWLIPYVACSITALGMLVHFWGTLSRFISRRRRETAQMLAKQDPFNGDPSTDGDKTSKLSASQRQSIPVVLWLSTVAALVIYCLLPVTSIQNARRPSERDQKFDYAAAGRIPVQVGGRVMPLDAYSRQTLKAMTNKDRLPMDKAPSKIRDRVGDEKMSAVQWLMEVATDTEEIRRLPMFRIDAEQIRSELDLERRESKLYSLQEIGESIDRFSELVDEARQKDPKKQDFKDKKLIELDMRTRQYTLAAASFRLPVPKDFPAEFFPEGTSEQTRQLFALRRLEQEMQDLGRMKPPGLIPPDREEAFSTEKQPQWSAFAPAFFDMAKNGLTEDDTPAGIRSFGEMIRAYGNEDPMLFNKAVDDHLAAVQSYPIAGYDHFAVSLERWLGGAAPTAVATGLYILAFILGLIAMAINSPRMTTAVWGTLVIAFVVHTIVIASRVYITGRAPVINLYSSAIFVGWAAVLFGIVIERIFRVGTGNLLAGLAGILTLRVADYLTLNVGQAETMGVLQAVLDTQFWLTTHVISVSLGYVATMVAGTLGAGYLISGWVGASDRFRRDLYRVIYGASCFGILFSFVGTVLGGLWADDSWGRFWGWDPKENGALLIVIWNALMLHARWDGMVKAHGFSLLAIGGNIITAWSWFGTNELGIGLHSYGFTEGMLFNLAMFFAVQAAFIVAGLIVGGNRKTSDPSLE